MPLFALCRQPSPGVGQKNRPVWPGVYVTGLLQPGEGSVDGYMGNPQSSRQVHHPRFTQGVRQIGNGLDVILRDLRGPIAARPAEVLGLLRR